MITIFFARYLFIVPIALLVVLFLFSNKKDRKRLVFIFLIASALSLIFAFIAGQFYYNPRPFVVQEVEPLIPHVENNGFPSNHALLTATISAVIFVFSKKLGWISALFMILVSIGRIFALLHHVVDVFASILISVVAVYLTVKIVEKVDLPRRWSRPFHYSQV